MTNSITSFLLDGCLQSSGNSKWFPAADSAIRAAFLLSPRFDLFAERVIQQTAQKLLVASTDSQTRVCEGGLARLLFIVGQFALHLFLFSEKIASRAKKCRQKAEEKKAKESKHRSSAEDDSEKTRLDSTLDVAVVTADDMEDSIFESISNNGIVMQSASWLNDDL